MAENSKIEWCDFTFNPWVGCKKISPACKNCYGECWVKRTGQGELWKDERWRASAADWKLPRKWNKEAEGATERPRVFCASSSDVFEDHPAINPQWRDDLFVVIATTPNLDWLLLTNHPENIKRLWPFGWYDDRFTWPNIWIGITVKNQEQADKRIPKLLKIPAKVRFLSIEPIGEIALDAITEGDDDGAGLTYRHWNALTGENWNDCQDSIHPIGAEALNLVICSGESGGNARFLYPEWARKLRAQCNAAGVAFHKCDGKSVRQAARQKLGCTVGGF